MRSLTIACCLVASLLFAPPGAGGWAGQAPPGEAPPAATPDDACPGEVARLGFLQGSWSLHTQERVALDRDEWTESRGRAVWTLREALCLWMEESERTHGDETVHGLRLLAYERRTGAWSLGEIDSGHGNLIVVEGYAEDGGLRFPSAHRRGGRLLLDRVAIVPRDRDHFDWTVETSSDGGETWTLIVRQRYARTAERVDPRPGRPGDDAVAADGPAARSTRPRSTSPGNAVALIGFDSYVSL